MRTVRSVDIAKPFDLEAQEAEAAEADKRLRFEQETEVKDTQWLMGSRRGRRILWRQLEEAGVFRSTFNPDPLAMAFGEGKRAAGLKLLNLIQVAAFDNYHLMVREANDDAAARHIKR